MHTGCLTKVNINASTKCSYLHINFSNTLRLSLATTNTHANNANIMWICLVRNVVIVHTSNYCISKWIKYFSQKYVPEHEYESSMKMNIITIISVRLRTLIILWEISWFLPGSLWLEDAALHTWNQFGRDMVHHVKADKIYTLSTFTLNLFPASPSLVFRKVNKWQSYSPHGGSGKSCVKCMTVFLLKIHAQLL